MLKSKVVLTCLTIVKLYSCVYRISADRTMALTATSVSVHRYFSRISSNCAVIPYSIFPYLHFPVLAITAPPEKVGHELMSRNDIGVAV